jgi:hypothetical protein
LAAGNKVTRLTDWSGRGNNAVSPTPQWNNCQPPILVQNALNGKPVLSFGSTGASDGMSGTLNMPYTNNFTYFIVFAWTWPTGTLKNAGIFSFKKSVADSNNWDYNNGSCLMSSPYVGSDAIGFMASPSLNIQAPMEYATASGQITYNVWTANVINGRGRLYKNGVVAAAGDMGTIAPFSSSFYALNSATRGDGVATGLANGWGSPDKSKSNIAEVLVYNSGLAEAERKAVEQYLRSKYGL